ncbi:hypothetical protein ACIBI4_02620 [Streptomyces sp. NPDC050418]|uniref:hypothetical protein n=1 Tax=Streptomyces sp. NPDC050418 TaxID=3365612 RepID=UPI0037A1EA9F
MTPDKSKSEQRAPKERRDRAGRRHGDQLGNLEVWARSAPIRLAGYEDDLTESHILRSVD